MIDIKEETTEVLQSTKGERGTVGTASAAQTIKQLWHNEGTKLSLKQFARQLAATKNENRAEHKQVAQDWFANKRGGADAKRSETNTILARAASSATKLSKKAKTK